MNALCFDDFGGPDVLTYRELPAPSPQAGRSLVRVNACGLNFADVYRRRGGYHLEGAPPYILGYEGAGIVEIADPDGAGPPAGSRVVFADAPHANAELVAAETDRLVLLPDAVSFEQAAAVALQGLTAQYLLEDSYAVGPHDRVVVLAAAGGVGLLLVQMAAARGAEVAAVASSAAKREAALAAGARHALGSDDWAAQLADITGWRDGPTVVYDSIGTTLNDSLAAVTTGGAVVTFGMAGGPPPPIDVSLLIDGSRTLVGGDLWNVLVDHATREARMGRLLADVAEGRLAVRIARTFALRDGAAAHAFLESRQAIGKVLLIP